jgi:alpha-glucoside transport system substrate-binding protein
VRAATLAVRGVLVTVPAAGCGPGAPPAASGLRGQRLEVAAVWSGVEQQHFELVLRAFTRQTGVAVSYASAGYSVPVFLRARLAAGRLPDVAFLPQPGLLRTYAAEHLLVPLNRIAGRAVASNYNPIWRRLGSVGRTLYGVWFKAANKSLIWYNEGLFERAGVAPPTTVDGLVLLAHRLARSHIPAFAVGGQTAGHWPTGPLTSTSGWPDPPAMTCWPRTGSPGPIPRSRPRCGSWPTC